MNDGEEDETVIHFSSMNDYGDEHFVLKHSSFLEAFLALAFVPYSRPVWLGELTPLRGPRPLCAPPT